MYTRYGSLTLRYLGNLSVTSVDFPERPERSETCLLSHGTGAIGQLSIFPESIWRRSLCVSNNALTAHMNLTSMNLSKSFFILFIFVDFATS